MQRATAVYPATEMSATAPAVHYRGLFHATYDIFQTHGLRGLFRGATARVLFHTPTTAITMAIYEECKHFWSRILMK